MARPVKKLTKYQLKRMGELALAGCKNNTIASIMGLDKNLIPQRADLKALVTKKRAERMYRLRKAQNESVEKGNPALLIFLGKNELGQTDNKNLNINGGFNLVIKRANEQVEDG